MRHQKTSHPVQHLGPCGPFVLCSVTHSFDGLSTPCPSATSSLQPGDASVGMCVYTLWTSSPRLQQTLTQPWNANLFADKSVQSGYRVPAEQGSFQ